MTDSRERWLKFAYVMLGVAAPVAAFLLWTRCGGFQCKTRRKIRERLQEIAVEDSFPASDPPASW